MTRKGYKHTELGEIPEDWDNDIIERIAKIDTGSKKTQDNIIDGKYPFFVRSQKIERINSYSYNCEAVLTAGDGVGTGKVFHYINGKFDVHQRVYVIHTFETRILPKYFYYYFSDSFFDEISKYTAKSSVDSVRMDMIAKMQIPLPPLPEQRAIASALSDVDALIEALDRLIDKKRKIKQGTMQQLLSGKKRLKGFGKGKGYKHTELGEIPEDWEVKTLGQVCSKRFNSGDIINNIINNNGKYPVIGGNGVRGYTDLYNFDGECCVIGRQGALCGNVRYFSGKAYMTEHAVVACVNNDNECRFLNHILSFLDLGKFSTQSAQPGLSVITLSEQVKIPLPPLPEQRAIASVLSDMDAEIEALEAKRNKYTRIKQGMMQDLLTGRVRLKI